MDNDNLRLKAPFFMVGNIRRSLEFYVAGLSFRMTGTWEPGEG